MRMVLLTLACVAGTACRGLEQGIHDLRDPSLAGEADCDPECSDSSQIDSAEPDVAYYGSMIIDSMAALDGFCEHYREVWGDLSVELNGTGATELSSLECLTLVDGELTIEGDQIETIDFPYLFYVGDFHLHETSHLQTLTLPSLTEASGSFRILGATSLSSADASSMRFTGELFELERTGLTNTGAFTGLSGVGTDFLLNSNDFLVSLSGLAGVNSIGGNFRVMDNDRLMEAEVQTLVEAIGEENIGGEVEHSGNGG